MTTFWRQNGLVVAGIALPLLVALGVLVAKEVERAHPAAARCAVCRGGRRGASAQWQGLGNTA